MLLKDYISMHDFINEKYILYSLTKALDFIFY